MKNERLVKKSLVNEVVFGHSGTHSSLGKKEDKEKGKKGGKSCENHVLSSTNVLLSFQKDFGCFYTG